MERERERERERKKERMRWRCLCTEKNPCLVLRWFPWCFWSGSWFKGIFHLSFHPTRFCQCTSLLLASTCNLCREHKGSMCYHCLRTCQPVKNDGFVCICLFCKFQPLFEVVRTHFAWMCRILGRVRPQGPTGTTVNTTGYIILSDKVRVKVKIHSLRPGADGAFNVHRQSAYISGTNIYMVILPTKAELYGFFVCCCGLRQEQLCETSVYFACAKPDIRRKICDEDTLHAMKNYAVNYSAIEANVFIWRIYVVGHKIPCPLIFLRLLQTAFSLRDENADHFTVLGCF